MGNRGESGGFREEIGGSGCPGCPGGDRRDGWTEGMERAGEASQERLADGTEGWNGGGAPRRNRGKRWL